jgi:NAD(P)-dependent dehydrogenase (short-subunit alcohol dehydrogenase family)
MNGKVCVISGVGPGTGQMLARRFAAGGYAVAMLARNHERVRAYADSIPGSRAYACDVTDPIAVKNTLTAIKTELGVPQALIHNAVRGTWGNFLEMSPSDLEANFQVNVMGLLHLGRAVAQDMIEAGGGAIMVTGNTSALRGKPPFAGFAPTKAAQRMLAQSMARTLGPKGIHVAYFVIDAVIDTPWARETFKGKPDEFFAKPSAIADTLWHVAHQDRSAWSFDVELRPFAEEW